MPFTITGIFLGEQTTVTVKDDCTLQANPATLEALELSAAYYDGHAIGPHNGPCTTENLLQSPISAWFLLPRLFEPGATIEGERPPVPDLLPGQDELILDDWPPPARES